MEPNKILVINDSTLMQKMFSVMLRKYTVIPVENGIDALRTLADYYEINLIISALNMPQMDGIEFLSRIKEDRVFSKIPVIVIGTDNQQEDIQRAMEAGASAYLKKPFQSQELYEIIERL